MWDWDSLICDEDLISYAPEMAATWSLQYEGTDPRGFAPLVRLSMMDRNADAFKAAHIYFRKNPLLFMSDPGLSDTYKDTMLNYECTLDPRDDS